MFGVWRESYGYKKCGMVFKLGLWWLKVFWYGCDYYNDYYCYYYFYYEYDYENQFESDMEYYYYKLYFLFGWDLFGKIG